MRIKNRLSPYPILDNHGDDYVGSSFTATFEVVTQFSEVFGKLVFFLDNEDIQKLIDEKKAQFVAHIECPFTCYRTMISSYDDEVEFKFDAAQVTKQIEIRTFIILTEDVVGYCSAKFHPDYQDAAFDLSAHQIIAVGSAIDYDILKDDRDLDTLPSIIQIVRLKDKKKGAFSVDTDNDEHILVGLADDVFELYAQLGKNTFKATAFSLVLFPALMVVLQRMYINRDDSSYTSMHWYQVIESILERNGKSIEDINVENDSLLAVCQSIFADPITRSLVELERCSERMG